MIFIIMTHELQFQTIIFDNGSQYDVYLDQTGVGSGYGRRAVGVARSKNQAEVLIDKNYYLSGGIREDQLPAIALHEKIELTAKSKNAHLKATVGEYQYILDNFGADELNQYHCHLCNLMGGDNRVRIQALTTVLETYPNHFF